MTDEEGDAEAAPDAEIVRAIEGDTVALTLVVSDWEADTLVDASVLRETVGDVVAWIDFDTLADAVLDAGAELDTDIVAECDADRPLLCEFVAEGQGLGVMDTSAVLDDEAAPEAVMVTGALTDSDGLGVVDDVVDPEVDWLGDRDSVTDTLAVGVELGDDDAALVAESSGVLERVKSELRVGESRGLRDPDMDADGDVDGKGEPECVVDGVAMIDGFVGYMLPEIVTVSLGEADTGADRVGDASLEELIEMDGDSDGDVECVGDPETLGDDDALVERVGAGEFDDECVCSCEKDTMLLPLKNGDDEALMHDDGDMDGDFEPDRLDDEDAETLALALGVRVRDCTAEEELDGWGELDVDGQEVGEELREDEAESRELSDADGDLDAFGDPDLDALGDAEAEGVFDCTGVVEIELEKDSTAELDGDALAETDAERDISALCDAVTADDVDWDALVLREPAGEPELLSLKDGLIEFFGDCEAVDDHRDEAVEDAHEEGLADRDGDDVGESDIVAPELELAHSLAAEVRDVLADTLGEADVVPDEAGDVDGRLVKLCELDSEAAAVSDFDGAEVGETESAAELEADSELDCVGFDESVADKDTDTEPVALRDADGDGDTSEDEDPLRDMPGESDADIAEDGEDDGSEDADAEAPAETDVVSRADCVSVASAVSSEDALAQAVGSTEADGLGDLDGSFDAVRE